MNRSSRLEQAKHTLEILERGRYRSNDGTQIDIAAAITNCVAGTRLYRPEELEPLRQQVLATPAAHADTRLEVVNETTLQGAARLARETRRPLAVLNFASAKNPGGGFLNGSQAQEESLARSSALYASLQQARPFYDLHRASPSLLYSDTMFWSPDCPVFRNDDGELLDLPQRVSFITSPAPNAGAIASNRPQEQPLIVATLQRRSEYVLTVAAAQGYSHLILGAWGCGVFRNDPAVVADAFTGHLRRGAWRGRFERVVFSVRDRSAGLTTLQTFQQRC